MDLDTKQIDYTAAFVHAPIDCLVFVEMPKGFVLPGISSLLLKANSKNLVSLNQILILAYLSHVMSSALFMSTMPYYSTKTLQ